jgi:hypothetical protein
MTKNKKRLYLLISIIAVLLLFFVLFFYFTKQNNQGKKTNPINQINKTDSKIETQKDLDNFNKAQENNSIETCSLISNNLSKDFCIKEIAVRTRATSSCLLIGDTNSQTDCSSMILLDSATASKDLAGCQEIQQSMLTKTCIERVVETDKNADCNLIKDQDLKDRCFSVFYYLKAKSANDIKLCKQIPEIIRRANCLSEMQNIDLHSDADKDGLDFLQEVANNTDPNNPDTDGDGYKDGDEFKNGFNPDGKGSLALAESPSNVACKDIKEEDIKAACLTELKGQPLDITKCGEIKDEKLKEYCVNILTPTKPVKPKTAFDAVLK